MKKIEVLKRSVVGVCAATLLTGLCVAPAFAAPSVLTDGEISTNISIDTKKVDQISVTLPAGGIAGVADEAGDLQFGEYAITNNSLLKLKVTNFKFTKDADASEFNLEKSTDFGTSSNSNALTLNAKVGTEAAIDLSTAGVDGGVPVSSSIEIINGGDPAIVSVTGQMKNFTKAGITADAKTLGSFVITVGTI